MLVVAAEGITTQQVLLEPAALAAVAMVLHERQQAAQAPLIPAAAAAGTDRGHLIKAQAVQAVLE